MNKNNIVQCDTENQQNCGQNPENGNQKKFEWTVWFDGDLLSEESFSWTRQRFRNCTQGMEITDDFHCIGCPDFVEKLDLIMDLKNWTDAEKYCDSHPDSVTGQQRLKTTVRKNQNTKLAVNAQLMGFSRKQFFSLKNNLS